MVTIKNWTDWLKENVEKLREDPDRNVPLLLDDCIDERDTDFEWTATHGFAASSECLGKEVMNALFKFLEEKNKKEQLLAQDKDGDIPVQSAIRSKASKHVIEHLIDVENIKDLLCSYNHKNQTPLFTAFDESYRDVTEILLGKCIEHNLLPELTGVRAPEGLKSSTILHKAFERRNVDYFEVFLNVCSEKGITHEELTAAVLVLNKRNETPWYYAVRFLSIEELEMVLTSIEDYSTLKIDSLYTDEKESTMLHDAYRIQKIECYPVLQAHGATHKQNKKGHLPNDRSHEIQRQTATMTIEDDNVPEIDQAGGIEDSLMQQSGPGSVHSGSNETSTLESYVHDDDFSSGNSNNSDPIQYPNEP